MGLQYIAASPEASDLWCMNVCKESGCPEDAAKVCRCIDDAEPVVQSDAEPSGFTGCVSISVDKTPEECIAECGGPDGCPPGKIKSQCKCGDDATKPSVLTKAADAAAARERKVNDEMAEGSTIAEPDKTSNGPDHYYGEGDPLTAPPEQSKL